MSKYNVGAYIRLSRDESYSDSDSIINTVINCLPCIYTVHQGNPYKMGLFRE